VTSELNRINTKHRRRKSKRWTTTVERTGLSYHWPFFRGNTKHYVCKCVCMCVCRNRKLVVCEYIISTM